MSRNKIKTILTMKKNLLTLLVLSLFSIKCLSLMAMKDTISHEVPNYSPMTFQSLNLSNIRNISRQMQLYDINSTKETYKIDSLVSISFDYEPLSGDTIETVEMIIAFDYNDSISKYTGAKGKQNYSDEYENYSKSTFDNNNRISTFIFPGYTKYDFYYDCQGRDSLWNIFNQNDSLWTLEIHADFEYEKLNDSTVIRFENWHIYTGENSILRYRNIIKYHNDKIVESVSNRYNVNLEIYHSDTTTISYNNQNQIKTLISSDYWGGKYKTVYEIDNDTLIGESFELSNETDEWILNGIGETVLCNKYYEKIQPIPGFIWDAVEDATITTILNLSFLSYGRNTESAHYDVVDENKGDLSQKVRYYYSPTSKMISTGLISGQLFVSDCDSINEISTTSTNYDNVSTDVLIKLFSETNNELMDSLFSDEDGKFKFKSVPNGKYRLEVLKDGLVQIDKCLVIVSEFQKNHINKNFVLRQTFDVVPIIDVTGETEFCEGGKTTLVAPTGYASYEWSINETVFDIEVSESGDYKVRVTNEVGCVSDWSAIQTIVVYTNPDKPTIEVNENTLTSSFSSGNQWYLESSAINDAINQKYTIEQTGNYSVQVTSDKGCMSEMSEIVNVWLTSVNDIKYQIQVYPNPTTGIIQIDGLLQNEKTVVSIFNVAGQLLEQKEINLIESIIDLSSYKKGTYYLSFNNKLKSAIKIIKE